MNITDALAIRRIAARLGCTAVIARTGDQLQDDREAARQAAEIQSDQEWLTSHTDEYPLDLWIARRAEFVKQIRERDPRTPEQRLRDEFEKEVMDTRRSDYPF